MNKLISRFAPVLFSLAMAVAPLHAADTDFPEFNYLADGQPDTIALLAPPPLPDSDEQKFDLAEVIAVHQASSTNELNVAMSQDKGVSIAYFYPIIGNDIESGKLPATKAFLKRVQDDAENVVDDAKNHWKRLRPYVVDPDLIMGKKRKSFSYPSGHSTESMTLALVLAELYPDKHDAVVAEAREIGWHRVEIARHYPTDIFAGRVLAQAIVRDMDKNPAFQKDRTAAEAEIATAQK